MTRSNAYVFKKKFIKICFFKNNKLHFFGSKKKIVEQFILSFKTKRFKLCSSLYKKNHLPLKNYLPLNVYLNSFG